MALSDVLDERVGRPVELTVERGGSQLSFTLPVADLDRLNPDEYVQFGDAVINNLSYQQARHFNRAAEGLFFGKVLLSCVQISMWFIVYCTLLYKVIDYRGNINVGGL